MCMCINAEISICIHDITSTLWSVIAQRPLNFSSSYMHCVARAKSSPTWESGKYSRGGFENVANMHFPKRKELGT